MFFEKGPPPTDAEDSTHTIKLPEFGGMLSGRVVVGSDRNAPRGSFVGAMKRSNNTAEMQAIVETVLFLLS